MEKARSPNFVNVDFGWTSLCCCTDRRGRDGTYVLSRSAKFELYLYHPVNIQERRFIIEENKIVWVN